MAWPEAFLKVLKDNDVRLVTYVPDNVLTPLIAGVTGVGKTPRDPALIRNRFMKGLGSGRGGDLDA